VEVVPSLLHAAVDAAIALLSQVKDQLMALIAMLVGGGVARLRFIPRWRKSAIHMIGPT